MLNYSSFSVRIAEAHIDRLPAILRAIGPRRVSELQEGIARVRSRFSYSSLAHNEMRISQALPVRRPQYLPKLARLAEESDDALSTVIRVLLYRAERRALRGRS